MICPTQLKKGVLEIWDKFSPRQNPLWDKFNPRKKIENFFWQNFFLMEKFLGKFYFSQKLFFQIIFFKEIFIGIIILLKKKFSDFVLDWILSRTEFCLGLHTVVVFCMQSFNITQNESSCVCDGIYMCFLVTDDLTKPCKRLCSQCFLQ